MKFENLYSSSKGNCFLLSDGTTKIMIDCGGTSKQMGKAILYKYHEINGVLVSHHHQDHSANILELIKDGIACYVTPETIDQYKIHAAMNVFVFDETPFVIGTLVIKPMLVDHFNKDLSMCQCYSFYVKSLVDNSTAFFAIDLHFMPFKLPQELEILAIECNYIEAQESSLEESVESRRAISHLSLESLLDILEKNDCKNIKEIHLLHLSHTRSEEEQMRKEVIRATGKIVYV